MPNTACPRCSHPLASDSACPACGHAARNGAARPLAPPEAANWVIDPGPPEMAEEFRRTFNETEYLAAVREVEKRGGTQIDDLIEELERKLNASA